ncbi:DUF5710 domain-containing protein [Alphaproteobacteria bacterium]|nr:DUF5710 domain-containing protein [Alphaproteobacteria bacterium]
MRFIKVPFDEKEDAKALGARWDATVKSWHVPQGVDPAKFKKWWRFLDCSFEEKDKVRDLGARWDKQSKKWFVPEGLGLKEFEEWWPAWMTERLQINDEDASEDESVSLYEVTGQAGGSFHLSLDENFRKVGGTAQVYFGWDEDGYVDDDITDFNVAAKFFFSSEDNDFTMFEREYNALKTLSPHPNIATFLDYGYDKNDNTFFIVTKYYPISLAELFYAQQEEISYHGESLDLREENAEAIAEKQTQSAAKNWLEDYKGLKDILEGLRHAYKKGILHRDLKPGNIMIEGLGDGEDVQLKLIDFGIATRAEAISQNQATVESVGTNLYTAESTEEELAHPETRDVYSFGVIAIELMSNAEVRTYADLLRVLEDIIEPLYPVSIVKIIKSCIVLRPNRRPKNVVELFKALDRETKKLVKKK